MADWSDGWSYVVRKDGSIYLRRGDPASGRHVQFDFYGDEDTARMFCAAEQMHAALPDLSHIIAWLENGCDPKAAVDELRIYQARIGAARAKATGEA